MKEISQKIVSFLLIPVVLFSTTSFGMNKHICMDIVYSVSYSGEAENCGMEMKKDIDTLQNTCSYSDEDCCKVEKSIIKGSIADKVSDLSLTLEQFSSITFFIISKYHLFEATSNKINYYKDYSPPKVIKNIAVLYQTFLL